MSCLDIWASWGPSKLVLLLKALQSSHRLLSFSLLQVLHDMLGNRMCSGMAPRLQLAAGAANPPLVPPDTVTYYLTTGLNSL
jgi:hypothetical protein